MNINDEKNSVQEINIIDLLQIIVKGIWTLIKNFGSCFGWLGRLAYQQKIIVGLCTLIGIGVGVYFSLHKVYRGEVEIKINLNDAYFYKNVIDPLYSQCRYRDYDKIAKDFGISIEEARKIASVKAYYYIDYLGDGTPNEINYNETFDGSDTTDVIMSDRLRLVVDCLDKDLLSRMDSCFNYFFSQNPQIVRENELSKAMLSERINAVSKEIAVLDSLRKKEYFQRKEHVNLSTDKMVLVEREIKLYHPEILALESERYSLIKLRNTFDNGVVFNSKFEINPRPLNRGLVVIPKFAIIGFVGGLFIAGLYCGRKKIYGYLNKPLSE